MNSKDVLGWLGSAISGAGSITCAASLNEIVSIGSGVIAIIVGILTIIYTIYKWYKRVTRPDSDGGEKITGEEIREIVDEVVHEIGSLGGKKDDADSGK